MKGVSNVAVYKLKDLMPGTRHYVTERARTPNGTNRNGTPHYEVYGREYYDTPAGRIEVNEWLVYFTDAVGREGLAGLFEQICDYCRKHHVWLKGEDEVKLHAAECLCYGAYKHWKDFDYDSENSEPSLHVIMDGDIL